MTTTSWTIRVDWHRHTEPTDTDFEHILEQLDGLHPALNLEHVDRLANPYLMSATITLDATSLRQATTAALQAVETAADTKARGLEVLTTDEFDRELARPQIPPLVGNADIAEMLGVTRQRAAQLTDATGFPPAVAHIKAGPLRVRHQVEHWASTWTRKTGRPKHEPDA